jgi:mutator protein MutT
MLRVKAPDYKFCPFCEKPLGIRIEEGKERKYCASCKWTYYPRVALAAAAIIVRGSKVLLVKRGREPYKGTWMFPGGFVDFGEYPFETVIREVKEETGLEVKKGELIEVLQNEDNTREPGHLTFFYKVLAEGQKIKTDKEKNKDISWFDIQKKPKIGWKNHQKIMKSLQERR